MKTVVLVRSIFGVTLLFDGVSRPMLWYPCMVCMLNVKAGVSLLRLKVIFVFVAWECSFFSKEYLDICFS